MPLSQEMIQSWCKALEQQMADITEEWAAVNNDRGELSTLREALVAREKAVALSESRALGLQTPTATSAPMVQMPLTWRGDSPRDIINWRPSSGHPQVCMLIHCLACSHGRSF